MDTLVREYLSGLEFGAVRTFRNMAVAWLGDRIGLRGPERCLVSISALSDGYGAQRQMGHFAMYDTETEALSRFRV